MVVILGPTASGKTQVALDLAQHLPVEVVSMDSAQVYRGMDVGTAKPGPHERSEVPHHLIDIIDPTERYSAARFSAEGGALLDAIRTRGNVPLLVGGTLLYYRALSEGLSDLPPSHAPTRAAIEERAGRLGWAALHQELARVDPASAARIAPTDSQRLQRALEVFERSGRPLTQWMAQGRSGGASFREIEVSLEPADRSVLHERIARRFDQMLAQGLVEELRALRGRYALDPGLPAMRAVGYRQAWQYLEGQIDQAGLRAEGCAATRQLAKRQLTWLRSLPGPRRFHCEAPDLLPEVRRFVLTALKDGAA